MTPWYDSPANVDADVDTDVDTDIDTRVDADIAADTSVAADCSVDDPSDSCEQISWVVERGGGRLDRVLADQCGSQSGVDLSRSRLQTLIETGQVELNGQVCRSKKIEVKPGDRLTLCIPAAEPLHLEPEAIPLEVLFEDEHLIILNKPAGLVVHPAPGHYSGTLVNALLHHCHDLAGIGGVLRPGIVHRLDKDTSGAIAVAKHDAALLHLQDQIRHKTARREYLGIVYGAPKTEVGTIDQPLGRHPRDRKRQAIVPLENGGRPARTHWRIQERLGNYSLLHFQLDTGRTHQIRVHAAFLGHPIVGDPDYSIGRQLPKSLSPKSLSDQLPGQALHAWRLSLSHPVSGEAIVAIAPPPASFERLLTLLRRRL